MAEFERPSSPRTTHDKALIFTREQIRRIDELATSRFGIPSLILMENAGRSAAEIIQNEYGHSGRALICCGSGNNGGDGYVIARHLHNAGWSVRVAQICTPERMTPDTLTNYQIATTMDLPFELAVDVPNFKTLANSLRAGELLIDALLGTGFSGQVRTPLSEAISLLNDVPKRATVAVDVPSGLDCDTGQPSTATIRADLTITFVGMKRGFLAETAKPFIGKVKVADIGAPHELIRAVAESKLY